MKYQLKLLCLFFFLPTPLIAQQIDSAIYYLNNAELSKLEHINEYLLSIDEHKDSLSTDELINYYSIGLNAAQHIAIDSMIYKFCNRISDQYYFIIRDVEKSLLYEEIAHKAAEASLSPYFKGLSANRMGYNLVKMGDYKSALDYFDDSIDYFKKSKKPDYRTYPISNMALAYKNIRDLPNAIKYTQACIPFSQKLAFPSKEYNLAFDFLRLSELFEATNDIDLTIVYLQGALEQVLRIDTINQVSFQIACGQVYITAARVYLNQNQWDTVDRYLEKAKNYKTLIKEYYYPVLLDYHLATNDLVKMQEALQGIPDTIINVEYNSYALQQKVRYYQRTSQYDKALKTQQELNHFNYKILRLDKFKHASFANAEYETNKKEEKIRQLEQENKSQELRWKSAILGLLVTLALLALVFYLVLQLREKNNLLQKDLVNKRIIEKQAAELRQLDQLKSRLFANISHELRTPLTLISGPINSLLKKNYLKKEDRQQLQIAKNNNLELQQLTNQILDLTKGEVGKLKATASKFYFQDLLEALLPSFQLVAQHNKIVFEVISTTTQAIELCTDAEKLLIILKNILANAFKYTPPNGQISIQCAEIGETMQIIVEDTGRGIEADDLPYIFDRYYQAKAGKIIAEGGTGIGLAISKEYIKLLRGNIVVKSEIGSGTTFTIEFPKLLNEDKGAFYQETFKFNPVVTSPIPLVSNTSAAIDQLTDHLLIVEDNLELCAYFKTLLEKDYQLTFAHNGQEALELLKRISPTLILTDLIMPILDGFELVKWLKKEKKYSSIPILMLTARISASDQTNALRIGVDDFLFKPFNDEVLKVHISNLLNFRERRLEGEAINTITETQEKKVEVSTIETTQKTAVTFSKKDQNWLAKLEKVVPPLIGDFNLTLDQVAKGMEVSQTQLNRKVKQLTGFTPKQYVQEIRFQEARRLLQTKTHTSVKSVAYAVGFKSQKNFSRNFKNRFGKYPSEYLL